MFLRQSLYAMSIMVGFVSISAGGILSDAMDSASGAVSSLGDAIVGEQNHVFDVLKTNGFNPQLITTAELSAVQFDTDSGTISVSGTMAIPGLPSGKCPFTIKWNPVTEKFDGSTLTVEGKSIPFDPSNLGGTLDYIMDHALEWIPNFGIAKRIIESEYDDVKQQLTDQYGADNFYLASEQFVSWACPTTVGKNLAIEVATQGAATDYIVQSVKGKAKEEGSRIEDWLSKRAQNIDAVAIATRILNGENPLSVLPRISIRWQNIAYKSHVQIAGHDISQTVVPETHWGFVIIWHDANAPDNFQRFPSRDKFTNRDPDLPPIKQKWFLGVKPEYVQGGPGCLVFAVQPSSPADKAGIMEGETITHIDGKPVGNVDNRHWVFWRVLNTSKNGLVSIRVSDADGAVRIVSVQLVAAI